MAQNKRALLKKVDKGTGRTGGEARSSEEKAAPKDDSIGE